MGNTVFGDIGLSSYMTPNKKVIGGNQFAYSTQNNMATDAIKEQAAKMAEEQASNAAKEQAAKLAANKSWYSDLSNPFEGLSTKFADWFTPQGMSGVSFGGGLINDLGLATKAVVGAMSMKAANDTTNFNKRMAEKTYARDTARQAMMDKLQIDAYNRAVQRENEGEARGSKFAENAGNGAFYK